ncbi:C25 family cysteine peptidase, partial [Thermodesulfobacteriota bacterium]
PEKLRNHLRAYADLTAGKEFVLLLGSLDTIPMRCAYTASDDHSEYASVHTDYYYEELTAEWDTDGDGFYGEYGDDMSQETEDYGSELHVGRIPWDESTQVQSILDGIIAFEADSSPRMRRVLGAASVILYACDVALWMDLARRLVLKPADYETTILYDRCPDLPSDGPLTMDRFLGSWEAEEPALAVWHSLGSAYRSYGSGGLGAFIDVENLPRNVGPAICLTTGADMAKPYVESLGRVLVRDGACAAFIGSGEGTWVGIDPVPAFNVHFEIVHQLVWWRKALAEAKQACLEYYVEAECVPDNLAGRYFHQNLFQFMTYGDPSIQLVY